MDHPDLDASLGQLAILHPVAVRVFEENGLPLRDVHRLSLRAACARQGIDPGWVLEEIWSIEQGGDCTRREASWEIVRVALGRDTEWEPAKFFFESPGRIEDEREPEATIEDEPGCSEAG